MRIPLLIVALCALGFSQQAPARPDFSGEWIMDSTKASSTGAPMRVGGPPGATARPGTVTEPRKTKDVRPVYPIEAQEARIGGYVILEATINPQGKVEDLRVLRSVPVLDRAAVEAVSKWEYTPTLVDGKAVPVVMTVTVTFSITGGRTEPGISTPTALWPSQPTGAVRPGFGRGATAPIIVIKQNDQGLTMTRKYGDASEEIKYRFDGRDSRNRLPGTGGAIDNTYTFVSRWDGDKLVTSIGWLGPQGARNRTETISVQNDELTIQTSRPSPDPSAPPFVQTNVFVRKK